MTTTKQNMAAKKARSARLGSNRDLTGVKSIVIFVMGFVARHGCYFLFPSPDSRGSPSTPSATDKVNLKPSSAVPSMQGIYPLMRDFGCGHMNMETPRVLKTEEGRGRYVVDVGLDAGDETLDAVQSGFIVFGFELLTGSMAKIRDNAHERGILDRVHFVEFDGAGEIPVPKHLPMPPSDGRGFAYIFNAGVSNEVGSVDMDKQKSSVFASIGRNAIDAKWSAGRVPILPLDLALPDWVKEIFFLKIDTQGFELKVLDGAATYLKSNKIRYVQYEFSPKLMRIGESGDPLELLNLMPSMGAVCFDMMGSHHNIDRPSTPIASYFQSINSGRNSSHPSSLGYYMSDSIGPWDDILCFFPLATG